MKMLEVRYAPLVSNTREKNAAIIREITANQNKNNSYFYNRKKRPRGCSLGSSIVQL